MAQTRDGEATALAAPLEFARVYDQYFHETERWLRTMGVPSSDAEDLAQEVFVVVARRMETFDGRNLAGWIFRIASLTAKRNRRRRWFKYLFARRDDVPLESFEWVGSGPAETLERREAQQQLAGVLAQMSEKLRTSFVLFEIEGYSGEEIAALLEIPVATVWTRLHHARRDFASRAQALRGEMGQ